MKLIHRLILIACFSAGAADLSKPIKVFILAGQSSMEGQGVVGLTGNQVGRAAERFHLAQPPVRKCAGVTPVTARKARLKALWSA